MLFKISKSQWALVFAYISMFALGSADNARGPLFPELISFYKLTNATGSLSFALGSAATMVGTILSVFVLRKIHLDRLMMAAIALMFVGLLVMGYSGEFSFYMAGTFIFGLGMGCTGVSQNLMIAENVDEKIKTKALSGLHSVYGLSSFLAPLVASRAPEWFRHHQPGITFLTDWRSAFYLTGFLCFLILIAVVVIKPEPEFDYAKPEDQDAPAPKGKKPLLMMAGFFASYVGAEILVSSRLALYMRTYFNMDLDQSSNYVTYFFVFLLIGRFIFAFRSFKVSLKQQMNASLALSLLCLVLGLSVHPFFFALSGLTMAPFYPVAVAYISEITGAHKRKYLTFVIGVQSLFVILMHIGVGYLTDIYGLHYAFGTGIILLFFSILCLNTHPKVY